MSGRDLRREDGTDPDRTRPRAAPRLRAAALFGLAASSVVASGCGTYFGTVLPHTRLTDDGNWCYAGVRLYAGEWRELDLSSAEGRGSLLLGVPLTLVDGPLSAAVDTAILPLTIPLTLARVSW